MRVDEIDSLKGIAILGVLFAHISFPDRLGEEASQVVLFLQWLFGWCVIAFFLPLGNYQKRFHEIIMVLFNT